MQHLQGLGRFHDIVVSASVKTNGVTEQVSLSALLEWTPIGCLDHHRSADNDKQSVFSGRFKAPDDFSTVMALRLEVFGQTLDFICRQQKSSVWPKSSSRKTMTGLKSSAALNRRESTDCLSLSAERW